MKRMTKMAAMGLMLAAAVAPAVAQETQTVTYNVQNLNIALTGWAQNTETTATKVRITNKDLVTSLGGTTKSKLIILSPADFEGNSILAVRTVVNKQNTDIDVTGNFSSETGPRVVNSRTSGNRTTGNEYTIDTFTLSGTDQTPSAFTFNVQGLTTATLNNMNWKSNVNGSGTVNDKPAVVSGTISTTSGGKPETRTIEVTPGG